MSNDWPGSTGYSVVHDPELHENRSRCELLRTRMACLTDVVEEGYQGVFEYPAIGEPILHLNLDNVSRSPSLLLTHSSSSEAEDS